MRLGYVEVCYLDTIKTLCSYFNRLDEKRRGKSQFRTINRNVEYGSGKYHYTETIGGVTIFSMSEKSPLSLIKEIVERENQKLY